MGIKTQAASFPEIFFSLNR